MSRNLPLTLILGCSLAGAATQPARAQEPAAGVQDSVPDPDGIGFGYSAELMAASTYVFRGIPQYNLQSHPSMQVSLAGRVDRLGPGSLSFSTWLALSPAQFDAQPGTAMEVDLSASYSAPITEQLSITGGYIAYLYPKHVDGAAVDGAHELFLSLPLALEWFTITPAVYVEFVRQQGVYAQLAVSRAFPIGVLTLNQALSAAMAAYGKYAGGPASASVHMNDVTWSSSLDWKFADPVYASARLSLSYRGTPESVSGPDPQRFGVVGGLAVGLSQ